jgi:hypothetical protein
LPALYASLAHKSNVLQFLLHCQTGCQRGAYRGLRMGHIWELFPQTKSPSMMAKTNSRYPAQANAVGRSLSGAIWLNLAVVHHDALPHAYAFLCKRVQFAGGCFGFAISCGGVLLS